MKLQELIQKIHDAPHMLVYYFAGCGWNALAQMHDVAGSSRTILEAVDIFSKGAMETHIGYHEKAVSKEVAVAMANRAFDRGFRIQLEDGTTKPHIGVGITGSIATDRVKRGDHHVWIGVRDNSYVHTYHLVFDKADTSREKEEAAISNALMNAIGTAMGIPDTVIPVRSKHIPLVEHGCDGIYAIESFLERPGEEHSAVHIMCDGGISTASAGWFHECQNTVIMPGSFNPLHEGHLAVAKAAAKLVDRPFIEFEITINNTEKDRPSYDDLAERISQFSWKYDVWLTQERLFIEKARHFRNAVFVVGHDTAERILDPKYCDLPIENVLHSIYSHGCQFAVAPRDGKRLADLIDKIPFGYAHMFVEIPMKEIAISSTELRRKS